MLVSFSTLNLAFCRSLRISGFMVIGGGLTLLCNENDNGLKETHAQNGWRRRPKSCDLGPGSVCVNV